MSKPVVFATYHNPIEASLVRNQLEAEGIRVRVEGDVAADAFAGLGGAFAIVTLEVAEEDLERARAVINRARAAPTMESPAPEEPIDVTAAEAPILAEVGEEIEEGPAVNSVDYLAPRALRAALFGALIPFLLVVLTHLLTGELGILTLIGPVGALFAIALGSVFTAISFRHVLKVSSGTDEVSDGASRMIFAALGINLLALLAWALVIRSIFDV